MPERIEVDVHDLLRSDVEALARRTERLRGREITSSLLIEAALRRLGIESRVAAWHSAEWEPLGKPHPGAFLSTAAKLGVEPTGCLAVEDSFNGAVSAKAARMRVVAVPEPAAYGSPRWGLCDALLPSLVEFDEPLLRSLEG